MSVTIERSRNGLVSIEVGRELLRLIFPHYPVLDECHPLPQWVKDKLAGGYGKT
jgi:hypothetical protein